MDLIEDHPSKFLDDIWVFLVDLFLFRSLSRYDEFLRILVTSIKIVFQTVLLSELSEDFKLVSYLSDGIVILWYALAHDFFFFFQIRSRDNPLL